MRKKRVVSSSRVQKFVESAVGEDLHAKRVLSLSQGTAGVIHAAALGVSAIGRGLALAEGLSSKHAIKQVDRLLSNTGVDVWALFASWVPYMLGARTEVVVALDWTDFDADDQATLALHMMTSHGRATPLMWKTVRKSKLGGNRNRIEDDLLMHLRSVVPKDVKVTVVADGGFGDAELYALMWELGFDYVIRFRAVIRVTDSKGETKPAGEWVPETGRPKMLRDALVTGRKNPIPAVVCVKAKGMKDAWCLATSLQEKTAAEVVKLYGRRFTIEESFRDAKDSRSGMGLSNARIDTPERRDRLLLLSAASRAGRLRRGSSVSYEGMIQVCLKSPHDKRKPAAYGPMLRRTVRVSE